MSKRSSEDAGLCCDSEIQPKRVNSSSSTDSHSTDEVPMDFKNSELMISAIGKKGERDEMQDRHTVNENLKQAIPVCGINRCAFFGLFDGHGGSAASDFCSNKFSSTFIKFCCKYTSSMNELTALEKSMKKIFIDTFKAADEEFLQIAKASTPSLKDGSTVTVLFLLNNVFYIANVGDSRAVICRQKPEDSSYIPLILTVDHSPMLFEERTRIQKSGGFVRDGRVQGVIEVSRSIGDGAFKNFGVTCIPDIKKVTLSDNDKFCLLACDGLWKVFTSDEAIKYVIEKLKALSEKELKEKSKWDSIVDDLSAEAIRRGCGDNVSIILIGFKNALINL